MAARARSRIKAGGSTRFDRLLSKVLPVRLHRLVRFGIAGIIATLFYFVIINTLVLVGSMDPVAASVLAYLIAVALSYCLQSWFTFRTDGDSLAQIARFLATSLGGLGISYATMFIVNTVLNWHYLIGALIVCGLIPVANYLIFRAWVFRQQPAAKAAQGRRAEHGR